MNTFKVWIIHSNRYDVLGYEDKVIRVHNSEQGAKKQLKERWKEFIDQSYDMKENIKINKPTTKVREKGELKYEIYIKSYEVHP